MRANHKTARIFETVRKSFPMATVRPVGTSFLNENIICVAAYRDKWKFALFDVRFRNFKKMKYNGGNFQYF